MLRFSLCKCLSSSNVGTVQQASDSEDQLILQTCFMEFSL